MRKRRTPTRGSARSRGGVAFSICLPRLHAVQRRICAEAGRFNVVCLGRRAGKTLLGIDRLVEPALRGAPAAWMSPTYRMLGEVWRSVRHTLHPITARSSEQERRIELLTGGSIEMWSLEHADAIRGRAYRRVVVDEAAMVRTLLHDWQQVIRPTLSDMRGDAWMLSTPKGRTFFWECFQRGQEDAGRAAGWRSWQMPTSVNPYIAPEEIEALRHELPERVFQQEVLAQFLDDRGGVFRRVLEAATAQPQELPTPRVSYVMGCDWARAEGGDYTVFVVLDSERKTMVQMERFSGVDYALQAGRLRALHERWQPETIYSEMNNMGGPLTELLIREGLPLRGLTTTSSSKATWVDALALAFERGELAILNEPVLVDELLAYEGTTLPGGKIRYSAPTGTHDDCVMALLLAWQGLAESSAPLLLWG